MNQRYRQTLR